MCGICGFIDPGAQGTVAVRSRAARMAGTLAHRGPDADGVWSDLGGTVALAHRRLSIIDLSPRGAQPMASSDDRFTIVFNGEIYNFRALRQELEASGALFRGNSDTEVALAAFSRWGIEEGLRRFNGMFALAVWDESRRELTLARDRMGEKPLYYGWFGGVFLFGSELKSVRAHPAFNPDIDLSSLGLYLRHGYITAPHTIYRAVRKLPAGTQLVVRPDAGDQGVPQPYWSLSEAVRGARQGLRNQTDEATIDSTESLLADAVALRMISDVPLGAFLSGGIDSSTVVALMQRASTRPVRTFSIGFAEREHDEAPFARAIAAHLGTEHMELRVTPQMALDLVPELPGVFDEPFGDSSAIPTALLSTLTRQHVTVALSGDGGDELFGGYTRYSRAERAWFGRSLVPAPARPLAAAALRNVARIAPGRHRERFDRFSRLVSTRHPMEQYGAMTAYWDPGVLLPGIAPHPTVTSDPSGWQRFDDPTQSLMYADAMTYLPDDILVKVDRASMRASLEARVPLLDHRVVEHAWALPRRMRVRDGRRKWVLRQVLARHVPPALFERPKAGFAVPLGGWLRGPLRAWAEELLDPRALEASGLEPQPIRSRWAGHLAGDSSHTDRLWIVLMYQAWFAGVGGAGAPRASA